MLSPQGGFPGGAAGPWPAFASGGAAQPGLSTQKELALLRDRLEHEENAAQALRQQAQHIQERSGLWQYRPPDGAPLHLRLAPDLDGPRSGDLLQPGDLFHIDDTAPGPAGVTFLRLANGRGWAFDRKPGVKPKVSRRMTGLFDTAAPQEIVLCVRAGSQPPAAFSGAPPGQPQAHSASLLSRPAILDSRLPPEDQQVRSMPSLLNRGQYFRSGHLQQEVLPPRTELPRANVGDDRARELYLHGHLEGFEILEPDSIFRPKMVQSDRLARQLPASSPSLAPHAASIPAAPQRQLPASSSLLAPSREAASHQAAIPAAPQRPQPLLASGNSVPTLLRVRVLRARGLRNTDVGSFFGNKSDPYVAVRFGSQEQKTPVINDNLDPVWSDGNEFTFTLSQPQGAASNEVLELEVLNSNFFEDDSLGRTSLSLSRLATGRWQRQVDALKSRSKVAPAEGELEYEVYLGTEDVHGAAAPPSAGQPAGPPPPPPQELQPGLYSVTRSTAVFSKSTGCSDYDVVGHLSPGETVQVLEVVNCASEARIRGRLDEPRGWIPLLDTNEGLWWVHRMVQTTYVIDNTWLGASRGGLAYRFSKNLDDKDLRPGELGGPPWGSTVVGVDAGDGWVQVQDGRYLPVTVNGVPVLKVFDGSQDYVDEETTVERELDSLYRELNRRMGVAAGAGANVSSASLPGSQRLTGSGTTLAI